MQGPLQTLRGERGQTFIGYVIVLMLITVVMVNVSNAMRWRRKALDQRFYDVQALAVAQQGFEDGLSFFRRQTAGVYLDDTPEKPTSQNWVTPWPIHPDSAFIPGSGDTDHYNMLSFPANTVLTSPPQNLLAQKAGARAIIRTFPLTSQAGNTSSSEVVRSPLWGRYVIRRQNYRNWSPGPNTMAAFTDPDAAHDITQFRNQGVIGSGNYWSLVSNGYVMANPTAITTSAAFENTAMFDGNNIISAPKVYYLNKRLRLGRARVYGELYRINFEDRAAAAWVNSETNLTINANGIVNGSSQGYGVAFTGGGTHTGGSGFLGGGLGAYQNSQQAPTVSRVFPGLDKTRLKKLADITGTAAVFPTADQANLAEVASRTTFYYITGASTFLAGTSQRVMTGVGLVFLDGDVTFNPGSLSAWAGIIFVDGNCTVRGPVELSGTLIVTGTLTVGAAGDNNKANVEYNADAVQGVKDYLQRFRVDKNSILVSN